MNSDKDQQNINNTNTTTSTSVPSAGISQNECNIITPTLSDVLNDDLVFRFYQCVKDIRLQQSPRQTSVMFYALCHALGQSISFLKVPNMNKIMFRQDEQIFAVNISGIVPPSANDNSNNNNTTTTTTIVNNTNNTNNTNNNNNNNNNGNNQLQQGNGNLNVLSNVSYNIPNNDINVAPTSSTQYSQMDNDRNNSNNNSNNNNNNNSMNNNASSTTGALAAAAAAAANFFSVNDQSQQLLQAALSTVNSSDPNNPLLPNVLNNVTGTDISGVKEKATKKKAKKPSPRDKEYSIRRNEIIQDLLKVTEANLLHQANTVDEDIKLIIQGRERTTKLGLLSPLHRFATFANLTAHYDSDFAPKNAGVYYNYEYFQLFLAFRDLEMERAQQMQQQQNDSLSKQDLSSTSNNATTSAAPTDMFNSSLNATTNNKSTYLSRPVMTQCRADIEKVLVNTNWEAIRRRLIIGERIYQLSNIVGRGFLLLSKQVSGRKLLHNFNTNEWSLFLRDFERPESLPLLKVLQTKYSPERLYQQMHPENVIYSQAMTESAAAAAAEAMKVLPLLSGQSSSNLQNDLPNTTTATSLLSASPSLLPTTAVTSTSASSLPSSIAYVDNKINTINNDNNNYNNNNTNTSSNLTSSKNHLSSLPTTTTTTDMITDTTTKTPSIASENSSIIDNNITHHHQHENTSLSNNDQINDKNIDDHNDGNPRKKLKSKE